jgi:hypothetical protein
MIVTLHFSQKTSPNNNRFHEKWCDYCYYHCFAKNYIICDNREAIIAKCKQIHTRDLEDCPLYCTLPPLQPYVPSVSLRPLYGPLSPLRPSVPSMTLCPLYGPLSPLRPSVPSTALCLLFSPLPLYGHVYVYMSMAIFPLRPSVPSTALCSFYSPLPPNGPLSFLEPSVSSRADYFVALNNTKLNKAELWLQSRGCWTYRL